MLSRTSHSRRFSTFDTQHDDQFSHGNSTQITRAISNMNSHQSATPSRVRRNLRNRMTYVDERAATAPKNKNRMKITGDNAEHQQIQRDMYATITPFSGDGLNKTQNVNCHYRGGTVIPHPEGYDYDGRDSASFSNYTGTQTGLACQLMTQLKRSSEQQNKNRRHRNKARSIS